MFATKSKQAPSLPQQFDHFDLTSIEDTWAEMEHCVEMGLVKSIGLSNFNMSQVQRVLDCCSIKPVVNQVSGNGTYVWNTIKSLISMLILFWLFSLIVWFSMIKYSSDSHRRLHHFLWTLQGSMSTVTM